MSDSLKDSWKKTGKDMGGAFKQFGKSIVKTSNYAFKEANEWADRDDDEEGKKPDMKEADVVETGTITKCPKCGADIKDPEAVFCLKCGEKLMK